jgi:hypothetical protein
MISVFYTIFILVESIYPIHNDKHKTLIAIFNDVIIDIQP